MFTVLLCALPTFSIAASLVPEKVMEDWVRQGHVREIERMARDRIAKDASDEPAHHYLFRATLNERTKRAETTTLLERCVERNPKAALCHHGLGMTLGANAVDAGVMSAMGSLGRVKESLLAAVELAPDFYDARRDMLQFYLQAPGLVGGSVAKARDLARSAPHAEHQKMLRAAIANYEKNPDEAEKLLASVHVQANEAFEGEMESLWLNTAQSYVLAKLPTKAKQITERLVKTRGDRALVHYQHATVLLV